MKFETHVMQIRQFTNDDIRFRSIQGRSNIGLTVLPRGEQSMKS
ncbi:hypothetical protein Mal48_21990 [Thalassoglobus polymorphus]|uniref:Uncharacterized protein n=1 Tax=Thalassoglobus polymorphus TaxID=2527994 RepID=A0A517QMS1_9PLAN|nr:hypothetical protein Mal48_21990 [Thalassoglobus polymorphus]